MQSRASRGAGQEAFPQRPCLVSFPAWCHFHWKNMKFSGEHYIIFIYIYYPIFRYSCFETNNWFMLFCYQSIYVCFLGHIETFFWNPPNSYEVGDFDRPSWRRIITSGTSASSRANAKCDTFWFSWNPVSWSKSTHVLRTLVNYPQITINGTV